MLCALIMAGGKGERFWPLSTDDKPKQFLNLLGEKTMIQATVNRLLPLIPMERIFVVTAEKYVGLVKEQLPELAEENIIAEPVGKNTAPCIALSALIINKIYTDAAIAVLPADHLINDNEAFIKTLSLAENFIEKNQDAIVTLGLKPDRPETGYGYIKLKDKAQWTMDNAQVCRVDKFVEKPGSEKAKEYLESGNYLWNGGMFIWKCSNILSLTSKFLKNTFNILKEIEAANKEDFPKVLKEKYKYVDHISVDYGIMEKAENIYVIPSNFGWDDVGTWHAVERYRQKDLNNNVCVGNVKSIESKNNILVGKEKPIVAVGLEDIFVVESDEVIFVGKKNDINRIKEIKSSVL